MPTEATPLKIVNLQDEEGRFLDPEGRVEVHSIWKTIQGEGPYAGERAVFIRLAGCNLKCPACDTDYTSRRLPATPQEIVTGVRSFLEPVILHTSSNLFGSQVHKSHSLVVITGGEPFRQNIGPLARELLGAGYRVQIETNGTLFLEEFPYLATTVVCSPKGIRIHPQLKPYVKALKYVLADGQVFSDGLPTTVLGRRVLVARPWPSFEGVVYVQPEDTGDPEQNKKNLKAAVDSCLQFGYTLGLQIHKIIGLE